MSPNKLRYLPNGRSKRDRRPDWPFIPLKLSLSNARCQKLRFAGVKQEEWSYGECSGDEARPTAELSNVKNGILRPQWLHPGSMCSEGGWSWWLKSAPREAKCNQACEMRMTTSAPVGRGCLAASLSAGHHQERLLGQPLWPHCGFKFPFEGGFVSSYFLNEATNSQSSSTEGGGLRAVYFQRLIQKTHLFKCCFRQWE